MKCSYPNIKLLQLDCYLSAASRTWIENLLPSPERDGLVGQNHHRWDYFLKPSGSIILRCFWDIQYHNDDYFTIITIIGPTINRSDASFKSNRDDDISTQQSTNMFLSALIALDHKHFITDHSHNVIWINTMDIYLCKYTHLKDTARQSATVLSSWHLFPLTNLHCFVIIIFSLNLLIIFSTVQKVSWFSPSLKWLSTAAQTKYFHCVTFRNN